MARPITATYRVQLHKGFPFSEAAAIADYLSALGISHLYCSPYLQAVPGSMHGYDVVNHHQVNEELGGDLGRLQMGEALGRNGIGQVLDIVPNHMAIGEYNRWWEDVLENGPSSRYARYFDVDWDPPEAKLRNLVLLPVLGDHYGRVLEKGEFKLERDGGRFWVRYYDHKFPIAPHSVELILRPAAGGVSDQLAFLADAFANLTSAGEFEPEKIERRHRNKEVLRQWLDQLCRSDPGAARAVEAALESINGDFNRLHAILEQQNYRLAYWRTAGRDLGYRRFFDVNTLIGIRVEEPVVFEDTHRLIVDWVRTGAIDGVRVDHPDGLRDPQHYCDRLRQAAPNAWIVVEKIIEPGEQLPKSWPVAGTTGYDFAHRAGGLLVSSANEGAMTELYREFTGEERSVREVIREKKLLILRDLLGSDVNRLTGQFVDVTEQHRCHRDYTRHDIHTALREVIASFPVYRTYARAAAGEISASDIEYINQAIEDAKSVRPDIETSLFDFIRDVLTLRVRGSSESEFVMRFQQFTGPAMAKGVEDTAYYVYNRLISLNEVGGDPGQFGVSLEEFHRACTDAQRLWPASMLASSTHDTKRSGDIRARLALLSEMPKAWGKAVRRWFELNERHRSNDWPDRNFEYFIYQTLVGAWPIDQERMIPYVEKAAREAKVYTTWTQPNQQYEEACRNFVTGILSDEEFRASMETFVKPLVRPGRINSLALTLLKLTAPGVPDTYQGTELWDLSLVDPDNRRPVDYGLRRKLLAELDGLIVQQVWERIDEGLPKLWLVRQALRVRNNHPEWFGADSTYQPLTAAGAKRDHVVAYSRGSVIAVAPRLVIGLGGNWGDTQIELPTGRWRNQLTSEVWNEGVVPLSELLKQFPVALLCKEAAQS